ncbi:hypothetical protein FJT64_004495 [Amphibalanus amphitrite]|uniref:Uncharacterized protein n=1 Tax=Amphibalanus amphitrite TaxID=1232801 RepID=A0A6A4VZ08_AMPAM|nr:hypothetical protein FJT64_004495 [Amphibalanus amphitrite]
MYLLIPDPRIKARSGGSTLAPFKVTPMIQLGGRDGGGDRPYMGGCCPRCTPHSKVRVTQSSHCCVYRALWSYDVCA